MKTETKVLGIILVLTAVLLGGGMFLLGKSQQGSTTVGGIQLRQPQNIDLNLAEKIGSDSAKVKLTEFSDFQCPACLAAEPTVDNILKTHSQDVELIYMNFPLPQHQNARIAATAALEAASEGKFQQMRDRLFATQNDWADLDKSKATDYLANLGTQAGVDPQKIKDAINQDKYKDKIDATIAEGDSLGVNSTPTFYINGKKVIIQRSFDEVKQAVGQELQNK